MKTKRALSVCAVIFCCIVCFCSCEFPKVVQKIPVDGRISEPHYETNTTYEYRFDYLNGEFRYVPVIKTEWVDTSYLIQYRYVFSNDSSYYVWDVVDKQTYEDWVAGKSDGQNSQSTEKGK